MLNRIKEFCDNNLMNFYHTGSKRLIVWFAGVNEPFFSKKLPDITGCDCLYLRDESNKWYTEGFLPSHSSEQEGVLLLKDIISFIHYEDIIFCGQSSGGYAALLYGIQCKADLVIAFSPQTRNTFNGQCYMCPSVPIKNIYEILQEDDFKGNIIINLSRDEDDHKDDYFWDDFNQISQIRDLDNVTLHIHPYHNHAISVVLREKGILYKYVNNTIKTYL